jgi:hypothetical protein
MYINIIPTVPWSPWWNEEQQIEDPLRDGLKTCCIEAPTAQHIIYNKMGLFERARRPATDPVDRVLSLSLPPPSPKKKPSTSYPKMSPHQFSHHQCADPRIDSLVSPHLESKCSGPLHKDSHPKPVSDRVMTPSRARISSPLDTAREQRPYHAPNWNVTHVIWAIRPLVPVRGLTPPSIPLPFH